MKKRRLLRHSAAFFPLTLLAAAVFGDLNLTLDLLRAYFALQIASLCAPTAFCNAAAREPSPKRVGRRFRGAMVQLLIGAALILGAMHFFPQALSRLKIEALVAALFVIIEQTFEERLFALSRRVDGTLLSLIANALLLLGLTLDSGAFLGNATPLAHPYLLSACLTSALLGATLAALLAGGSGFSPLPLNYAFAPNAMVQELFYPAALMCLVALEKFEIDLYPALVGWTLWRLSRTVCRRKRAESKPLDWLLVAAAWIALILALFFPPLLPYALACCAALLCAAIVYLAPSLRLYICMFAAFAALFVELYCPFALALF